ncbi:MAG: NAD(P)/FAD-dependent oxidoreductase [Sulfurimonas sp.]
MNSKTKIIIVGAGYAGLQALEILCKNNNNEIYLFDKHPYHYLQTEVYNFIANEHDFSKITIDLFTYTHGFESNVTFYKEEIMHIDFQNKKISTNIQRYAYDYLVIAVGSRTKFVNNMKGLKEYAHGVKSLQSALYFKQKFELSLFKKIEEEGRQCTPLNIVIAGAGLSGVEIAAQMASFSNDFYKENHFLCRKLNIVIINSSANILKGVDKHLVKKSTSRLNVLGVQIKNNTRVLEIQQDRVILTNNETMMMDFMIFTGGIEPNQLIFDLELEKNEKNFLVVNEYLQCSGHECVFAIGDCTTLWDKQNNPIASTADVAEQMGYLCADNITSLIQKKPLRKHTISSRGILIAIGKKYTVGKLFGFYIKGYFAYLIKKIVELVYEKKLNYRANRGASKIFK